MADDPLVCQGATAYLATCPDIRPVPPGSIDRAEVVLVITGHVSEGTLSQMQHAAGQVPDQEMCFVLVCDAIQEAQLLRVLAWGMVSVLLRGDADYERIACALLNARDGRVGLPGEAGGWLESRLRTIQHDVLDPLDLTTAGLFTREVDVLRMLADGLQNREIAERLNCSERTVRNIIKGLLSRMKLRNRAHAVAYALRSGVM
jgi:DNA-binding NarL/FixJ family response regulator